MPERFVSMHAYLKVLSKYHLPILSSFHDVDAPGLINLL